MDISIIIVNWNTKDLLRNCLNSIYQTVQNISFEIIVVDNASHDGSVAMLREEFPQVTIIENTTNLGFGAANNQAISIMKGRYALLLNTDTILTKDAVYELFSFMEAHPDAATACGQLLNADGSKQNSIASFPTLWTLFLNTSLLEYLLPKSYPSKRYDYKWPIEVDSGIGACLMVRKQAIDEVGMFDERYFFFFEETDWALQMKTAGWKIYHVPSARIYHLQGQSIGRDIRSRIEFYRSRYQFFRKWKGRSYYQLVSLVIFVRTTINWLLTSFGNLVTLCTNKNLRNKWVVNSKLILWHLNGRP
ncbi:MAG: glycosyltransferase family 2 protein [Deltaproteobacteria bacterium]|nr:MAG: glycosyltransferase family 2 protein [Deltaproteobacteria bacterium]